MSLVRVGVVRGGIGDEYDVSLETGKAALFHMPKNLIAHDILITRDGVWHIGGIPTTLAGVARSVDVIWNALHGLYGEDGKIQQEFETFGIPYTGSKPLASALAMNKIMTKELFKNNSVFLPKHRVIRRGDNGMDAALEILRVFPPPFIVKPVRSGSSVGVSVAKDFHALVRAIETALVLSESILVEEYINGKEVTVGVIDAFRNEGHYVLPVVEICKDSNPGHYQIFSTSAKRDESILHTCPSNFNRETKNKLSNAARLVHSALGLRHYSRSDFIVSPRGVYFLEVNSLPGLSPYAPFPRSLEAVGADLTQFIKHVVSLALEGK